MNFRNGIWLERALGLTWATTALVLAAVPSGWAETNRLGSVGQWEGLAAPVALGVLVLMSISVFRGLRNGFVVSLHLGAILVGTLIAGQNQPDLWVHPFGLLVLNLTAAAATFAAWRLRAEIPPRWAFRVLLGSISVLWFTQGLLPKMLYQHPLDLELVGSIVGGSIDSSRFLWILGALEIVIAALTLILRGTRLRLLLLFQATLLVAFVVPSAVLEPELLLSPFAPLQKTLLVAMTALVARSLTPKT